MGRKRGARDVFNLADVAVEEARDASLQIPVEPTLNLLNVKEGDVVDDGPLTLEEVSTQEQKLAHRLGKSEIDSNDVSGTFTFTAELLKGLSLESQAQSLGLLESHVKSSQKEQKETKKSILGASSSKSLAKTLKNLSESSDTSLLTLDAVQSVVARMEADEGLLPELVISKLLRKGCISDLNHTAVLERILVQEKLDLLYQYLEFVADLQETTVIRLIIYFLDREISASSPFPGFTASEAVVLGLMSWNFDAKYMKLAAKSLDLDIIQKILDLLDRSLTTYSFSHAEALEASTAHKDSKFPCRLNVIKWIEVLLDSHYPSLLKSPVLMERVAAIQKLVSDECLISDHLINIRAALSTISFVAKSYGKRRDSQIPKPFVYEDYKIEISNF